MDIISLRELIIDNCLCAFDPGCEVLDKNNPFQTDKFTHKEGIGKENPQYFIHNHYY